MGGHLDDVMMKKPSNFSSNSNDSELEIFIDASERDLIRRSEPGYYDDDEYGDINSNVDLIKFEESMEVGDKEKRESVSLNASMTDDVGFDAARDDNVTFDAKPDRTPKKVKFVSEEESDGGDLFENMEIVDANDEDGEKEQFSMNINALNDVLSACQNAVSKAEEREKDEEDTTESKSIGATWAKIKKEVSNEGSHKKEKEKKNQHRDRKKSKNNKKKSKNQKKKHEKRH